MNENANGADVANKAASASQRFVAMVMREFTASSGKMEITPYQEELIKIYFIGCDKALRYLENKRIKDAKGEGKYAIAAQKKLPYTWENVNIGADLAQSIATFAKSNLNMMIRNHLFPVPYFNGKNHKYDLTFQEGYEGLRYEALKYSLFPIVDIEVDLLYTNDKFKMIKNCYDGASYELEIPDPFDRGEIKGGYAYIRYQDTRQNKLIVMTKEEIDNIKDKAPSSTFWDSWYKEMAMKTILRKASKSVPLDPKKFDDYYRLMRKIENDATEAELAKEIKQNANREPINVTPIETPPPSIPANTRPMQAKMEMPAPAPAAYAPEPAPAPADYPPEVAPGEMVPGDIEVDF